MSSQSCSCGNVQLMPGSSGKAWLSIKQKAILPPFPLLLAKWEGSAAEPVVFLLCQYVCLCAL